MVRTYTKRPTSERARKAWDWAEANLGTLSSMQLESKTTQPGRGFFHEWTFFLADGRKVKKLGSDIPTGFS